MKKFSDNIFHPKVKTYDVPKKSVYVFLPYSGNLSKAVSYELSSSLGNLYNYVKCNFNFKNTLSIGSLFSFKDILLELMHSCLIYEFN